MINKLPKKTWMGANFVGIALLTLSALPSVASPRNVIRENHLFDGQTISETNNYSSIIASNQGQNFFNKSPRLIDSKVTHEIANSPFSTYYFTIEVPSDAHAPLKAIKIEPRENWSEKVSFKQNETIASIGDSYSENRALSLMAIGGKADNISSVIVSFDKPIQPGQTVTIGIKPERNPDRGGVYLLGVTAYPEGENSQGLYLGVGRFHIIHN